MASRGPSKDKSKRRRGADKNQDNISNGTNSPVSNIEQNHKRKRKKQRNDENNENITKHNDTKWITTKQEAEEELKRLLPSDPVLQIKLAPSSITYESYDNGEEAPIVPTIALTDATDANLLSRLLHPLPPSTFLSKCFRQRSVYVQSNNKHRADDIIQNYMFGLDVKKILSETSSDSIFLWILDKNNHNECENNKHNEDSSDGETERPIQSVEISDPQTAYTLHMSNRHATYCRAPPELEQPLVSSMLRDTGLGCGQYDPTGERVGTNVLGRGEVEVFIGTCGHVTDWHTDFQENFTIQLSGSKRWTLKQGTCKHPLRGMTPHYNSPATVESQIKAARLSNPDYQFGKQNLSTNAHGDERSILMKPGDVLYFPAGMWHKVETVEDGVSINISLMGVNYATLVCGALEHVLVGKDSWREIVWNNPTVASDADDSTNASGGAGSIFDGVMVKLDNLLKDLPTIVSKFARDGGAQSILPPILRRPPVFEVVRDELSVDEGTHVIGEEGEGDNDVDSEVSKGEISNDDRATDTNSVSSGDQDQIIDVKLFHGPSDWTCERPPHKLRLVKNPLASLMRMKDVTSFYSALRGCDPGSEIDDCLYIINVSFAGNEMHESSVRVVLRDVKDGVLHECCKCEEKGIDPATLFICPKSQKVLSCPPPCLFYYGYFNWVE